ncbi:MAG: hypothetical protein ABEK04_06045 [Candidatus Nanohalobium sp.]
MRLSLILVVSLALVASGCSMLGGSMSPEQKFKSQLQDMTKSNYHVVYNVEMNVGGYGGMISGLINQPEIYSKGDKSKFVVGVSSVTAAAYDIYSDSPTVCTQGSLLGGLGSMGSGLGGTTQSQESELSCNRVSSNFSMSKDKLNKMLKNVTLEIEGTKTIAGRKCTNYLIKPSEKVNSSSLPGQTSEYAENGKVNVCLDNQKGYLALLSVKVNQTSELRSDGGMKEALRLEVTKYNTNFEGVTMEVPVDVSASLSCDPFETTVTTFDYSGEVTISVNGEKNITRQVESSSKETFSLNNETMVSGTNEVTVYTDSGESKSATCYDYSFESDFDYNYSTDYNYSY